MDTRPKILVNAMHTTTGGGVIYLRGILGEMVRDVRFAWVVLAPQETLDKLSLPEQVEVRVAPKLGFVRGHVWEQFELPFLARGWGCRAMLCNANYVPLLARKPMPIVHTTARAAGQALTRGMQFYWWCLKMLTTLSLWRAPLAFAVAGHVVSDYVGARVGRKVRVAYPAVQVPDLGEVQRDPNLVVTVGDFYAQKDYATLVRAFALLRGQRPGTRLLMVGRPVDPLVRDEVLKLVRELGIADAVTLTGAVPHDVLLKTMAKASVYVSTSLAECFNMPVLEALACGVPCVLGESVFQREVAGECAVYVPQHKGGDVAAAFAVAMFGVMENAGIADTLRKRGLERAKGFSWVATAKVLMDGITQVTGVKA